MKPLFVLLASFLVAAFVLRLIKPEFDLALSGRISLAIMLVFTAMGHFMFTEGMSKMIPDFVPFRSTIIILSGLVEIAFAVGILIPGYKERVGLAIIVFLLLVLPANVYASINHIDYQTGALNGKGLAYLWLRVPLQIFFMAWTYLVAIRF